MSERRLTKREYKEFREYLRSCTNDQLRNILQKEKIAGRRSYINMTMDEIGVRNMTGGNHDRLGGNG